MKSFKEFLESKSYDKKLYRYKDEISFADGDNPNSINSYFYPKKGDYVTGVRGDNFDRSMVNEFLKYSLVNKPIKSGKNKELFELPVYDVMWNGNNKPVKVEYFVVSSLKESSVYFFKTKKQAIDWMND